MTAAGVQPRHQPSRAGVGRADHDRRRVVRRQRLHRVLERLALVDRRPLRADRDDVGAQTLGRELEARAGAGAGLVEEVHDRAAAQRRHLLDLAAGDLVERLGAVEDPLDRGAIEIVDREQMPSDSIHAAALGGPVSRQVLVRSSLRPRRRPPRRTRTRAPPARWGCSCPRSRAGSAARGDRGRSARRAGRAPAGRSRRPRRSRRGPCAPCRARRRRSRSCGRRRGSRGGWSGRPARRGALRGRPGRRRCPRRRAALSVRAVRSSVPAGVRRAPLPAGGCRPAPPRRPGSSQQSRVRSAPACVACHRGRARPLPSLRAPSWPHWTGLKGPTRMSVTGGAADGGDGGRVAIGL